MGLFLSLFCGIVPALFFAWIVYWFDRYDKEPKLLVGGVFLWGAIVAAGAAYTLNTSLGLGIYLFTHSETATDVATGTLIAPVVEEILKGLAVLVIFIFARHEFDSILDGIVYASIAALGFAATENTLYIYRDGYLRDGYAGLLLLVFIRVILVGWQHPFYTAFFGIGLAITRLRRSLATKLLAPLAGLLIAIFAHSLHNTLGTYIGGGLGSLTGAFIDWSGWIFMFLFALWAMYREQQWIVQQLREEVTLGLLSPMQYRTACSSWAQGIARFGGLFNGRFSTTDRFYRLCAKLAYKKEHLRTLGEEDGNSRLIARLRQEIARLAPYANA